MTVFVDSAIHLWRGRRWCHLFSSDLDELHRFARKLGLRREWHQEPPVASWPHYDVTEKRRDDALRLGAQNADRRMTVLVSKQAMVAWCESFRPDAVEAARRDLERWQAPPRTQAPASRESV